MSSYFRWKSENVVRCKFAWCFKGSESLTCVCCKYMFDTRNVGWEIFWVWTQSSLIIYSDDANTVHRPSDRDGPCVRRHHVQVKNPSLSQKVCSFQRMVEYDRKKTRIWNTAWLIVLTCLKLPVWIKLNKLSSIPRLAPRSCLVWFG